MGKQWWNAIETWWTPSVWVQPDSTKMYTGHFDLEKEATCECCSPTLVYQSRNLIFKFSKHLISTHLLYPTLWFGYIIITNIYGSWDSEIFPMLPLVPGWRFFVAQTLDLILARKRPTFDLWGQGLRLRSGLRKARWIHTKIYKENWHLQPLWILGSALEKIG